MQSYKVPRILTAVLFVFVFQNLVFANPLVTHSIFSVIKNAIILSAHDDVSDNIGKARKAKEITICGGGKECTPKKVGDVMQVLRGLERSDMHVIILKNLDMTSENGNDEHCESNEKAITGKTLGQNSNDNYVRTHSEPHTNGISKQESPKNCRVYLKSLLLLRFTDVSPTAMVFILRRLEYGELFELEIETTCDDISGPLAAIYCCKIIRLVIKNSSGLKKYDDLRDNSTLSEKSVWWVNHLVIYGKDNMSIPSWVLQRVTKSATLSLRHYFFLPEDTTQKLFAETLFITNANSIQEEDLEAEIKKRKTEAIAKALQEKVFISSNMVRERGRIMPFDTEYATYIFYYFVALYSKIQKVIFDFKVDPNDKETAKEITAWVRATNLPNITPESVFITINNVIIGRSQKKSQ